ncbi:hypothetical protein OHV05_15335 [Kitasatospora sp. NBC_00070]|uniref:hypothetical protein n=1 Tax=Kitasatospora sp. NBC_00070 TaxID=2975962 RepID=UPI00324ACAAE
MSEQPTTGAHTKATGPHPQTLPEQQATAREFAAKLGDLIDEHHATEAAERLRKNSAYARARGLTAATTTRLVYEAYVDDELSLDTIADVLNLSRVRVQTEIDRYVKVWHRTDLQAGGAWTPGDFLDTDTVERGDDEQAALDQLAREILDEELPTDRPDTVTAVRVMLWTGRPGPDEDAVATAEATRN